MQFYKINSTRSLRIRYSRIVIFLSILILFTMRIQEASAEETSKAWALEPEIYSGIIYEYTQYISYHYGGGISACWRPESWAFDLSFKADKYTSVYFGVTQDTIQELLFYGSLNRPFLTRVMVNEWKWDQNLLAGRALWGKNLYFLIGIQHVQISNNFSTMNILGPSAKAEINYEFYSKLISLSITGVYGRCIKVVNHRDDFVLFDDKKSISYAGELKGLLDWYVLIALQSSGIWSKFFFGYKGGVTYFKYINRYNHGITARIVF